MDSFPAIHLKKMDWMDFVLKFSGEILVVALAVSVAGLNLFYFAGSSGKNFQDSSLAGNFLDHHIALNPELYAKNSSIVTEVSGGGFFPEAQADDFTGLSEQDPSDSTSADPSDSGNNIVLSDDNSIIAPSPDSIQGLIDQAVQKIYTTQAGDTLASIAAANNINVNSIIWSNPSLNPNAPLQPGWSLIIPPVNGVAVIADSNTTLPDLAVEFSPDRYNPDATVRANSAAQLLATIISYNGLDSAEDINAGDFIVIPGGVVATPPVVPTPVPKAKVKNSGGGSYDNNVTSIGPGYDGVGHYFPVGYCTYYVATQMKITFGGNARNWIANALASGYVVKGPSEPAPRTAVVFSGSGYGRYGHVAYVESVNGDGTITVSEMNFDRFNRVDERTIATNDPAIKGYIYP